MQIMARDFRSFRRIAAGAALGALVVVAIPGERTAAAGEPDKNAERAACADSYKNAQVQMRSGALRRARESLLVCVADKCPSVLQPDCMRWLTEVEAAMPTMAFAAKGADGKDVTDVRVTMDGQPLRESIDGKAVPVDPGTHMLRFEHGGETPIDQQIVVREGEKARVVTVSWAKAAAAAEGGGDRGPAPKSGSNTAAWVFGGLGAASLATFGVLGIHGMTRRSALEKDCFGSCSQDKIDSVKTEFAIADVALGVGIVSVGVATVLFLTGGSSEQRAAVRPRSSPAVRDLAFGAAPQRDGAAAALSGRF
jgi:hypothetical protein